MTEAEKAIARRLAVIVLAQYRRDRLSARHETDVDLMMDHVQAWAQGRFEEN